MIRISLTTLKENINLAQQNDAIFQAAQIVNFYFVPFLLRPLYVNVVALFWNTYLAWRTNLDQAEVKQLE